MVFTGGTAKLPGLVDFSKDVLELPARLGKWGHINKIVDGLDEQIFGPAVGLMLLDMLLGPAELHSFSDNRPGLLQTINLSVGNLLAKVRKR
ncbi:hypothetical protein A3A68_00740 [Candidatus Saccharibacteria bacterium RIFCSPLOWO2_01_FULL_48_13]|nr:MAG: hypothetical protein A3A68_00740 [Candidatus Saccharibacteria bacterium RIFCSPLOWO2_01_FULL_48_13]